MRLRASFTLPLIFLMATASATLGQIEKGRSNVAPNALVSISACPDSSRRLPKDLRSAFDAVVIVRAGSTSSSGVVISADGYAVTTAHVVSGLNEVPVFLHSGDRLSARVVSVDTAQDVALVRLPGSGHACLPVARKATPPAGTPVYAIGAAAGGDSAYSVTSCIISSFRPLSGYSYLQTDAILKPGTGGGPILTRDGQVIAVISWNLAAVGFDGLAFGVPVDAVSRRLLLNWRQQ